MKYPFLFTFLVLALSFSTVQPFTGLNAAELWNKQKKSTNAKTVPKTYYNKSKSPKNNSALLYNSQGQQSFNKSSSNGLQATLEGYRDVQMSGQHPSKLWAFMTPSALANRQADIDNALQIEYETRKETAKNMTKFLQEVHTAQKKGEQEYQKQLAEYQAKVQAEELAKQQQKEKALKSGKPYNKNKSYSSKTTKKKIYKKSASNKKGSGETTVTLKKPKRLFNDPNK